MSNFRQHFFGMGSTLVCDVNGTPLKFTCTGLTISDVDFLGEPTDKSIPVDTSRGILEKITTMVFTKGPGAAIEIKGASSSSQYVFDAKQLVLILLTHTIVQNRFQL